MAIKAQLVDLIQRAHEEVQTFVAGLSDEERAAVGTLEHWSAKDLAAHLAEWQARSAQSLAAARRGEPPPRYYHDIDQANAEIFARYHDRPWAEVLDVLNHAQAESVEHVQAMTEDALLDTSRYPWQQGRALWRLIVGNEYLHPLAHLTQWYAEHGQADQAARLQETAAQSLAVLSDAPDWQGLIRYNLACYYALSGQKELAIATLTEALRLNPGLAGWSRQDPDLASIREEPAYRALVEAS